VTRRFQFRLRTLMIVVTALAVACCVIVDRQRLIKERDEAQQKAVEEKQRADETITKLYDVRIKFINLR
jgi:hypothetical protein